MQARALGKYFRISPIKLRKVIKALNGEKKVDNVLALLQIMPQKGAKIVYKVLHSAKANYKNLYPEASDTELVIKKIEVDQGPVYRRWLPRARGRADMIRKPTSHIFIEIGDNFENET